MTSFSHPSIDSGNETAGGRLTMTVTLSKVGTAHPASVAATT